MRCLLEHGFCCCLPLNVKIGVQTGVSSGPVKQAVDDLFANDVVRVEYASTVNNAYAIYKAAGGNDSRVITVPLVTWMPTNCTGNNCWAQVNGFAAFFLRRKYQSGQKQFFGEFIKYEVPGEGVGNNGTALSVRLVQ